MATLRNDDAKTSARVDPEYIAIIKIMHAKTNNIVGIKKVYELKYTGKETSLCLHLH